MVTCFFSLARNPEVQKKCYDEIVEVFGTDTKRTITVALLNQLSYLELTIKESLRLFALVPIIGRFATEDVQLSQFNWIQICMNIFLYQNVFKSFGFFIANNRLVPKGCTAFIMLYEMFRNPLYFENPLDFKPERFLEKQASIKKNPFAYVPFSAGPR